jgi:hypothetical protein
VTKNANQSRAKPGVTGGTMPHVALKHGAGCPADVTKKRGEGHN